MSDDMPIEEQIAARRQAEPAPAVKPSGPTAEERKQAEIRTRTIKLDKKRPYGTCHGFEENVSVQSKFYQDGLYFDINGEVIPGVGKYAARVEQAARPKVKVTLECEVDDDGNPIIPDVKAERERAEAEAIRKKGQQIQQEQGGADIDLYKWANHEEDHPYFMVRAKIMTIYGKDLKASHDARDFILSGDFLKLKRAS